MRTCTPRILTAALAVCGIAALPTFAQPANDECTNPTPITGTGSFAFDMNDATASAPGFFCNVDIAHDVWFCWTATCDGAITVSTCGSTPLDTTIAIYAGCACPTSVQPPIDPICCNDDSPSPGCAPQSEMTCDVVCGQQYMIRIADREFTGAPGVGAGGFRITCANECPTPEPATCDDCCGAAPNFSGYGKVAVMTQQFADGPAGFAGNVLGVVDMANQGAASGKKIGRKPRSLAIPERSRNQCEEATRSGPARRAATWGSSRKSSPSSRPR